MNTNNIAVTKKSKTVIVTGAAGNLGQAVVQKFLQEGYTVIGTVNPGHTLSHQQPADAFETAAVDLLNADDTEKFVQSAIKKYGTIDVAVCTVGGFAMGSIAETTSADILQQYKLNFETAYNIARPVFLKMMEQNYGRIFLIGSKPGTDAANSKGKVAYSLAKSLIFRLAALLNDEAKGHGVVTIVAVPGTIDTPQNRKAIPGADFSKWVSPENIAAVIHYYCTSDAAAIREPVIKLYG